MTEIEITADDRKLVDAIMCDDPEQADLDRAYRLTAEFRIQARAEAIEECAQRAADVEPFDSDMIGSFEHLTTFYYGRDCAADWIRKLNTQEDTR